MHTEEQIINSFEKIDETYGCEFCVHKSTVDEDGNVLDKDSPCLKCDGTSHWQNIIEKMTKDFLKPVHFTNRDQFNTLKHFKHLIDTKDCEICDNLEEEIKCTYCVDKNQWEYEGIETFDLNDPKIFDRFSMTLKCDKCKKEYEEDVTPIKNSELAICQTCQDKYDNNFPKEEPQPEEKKYIYPNLDEIFLQLQKDCNEFLIHGKWYELYDDGCPFDQSGDTRPLRITKQQYITDLDFHPALGILSYIYLGRWEATYISGYGKGHISLYCEIREDMEKLVFQKICDLNIPKEISENINNENCEEYFYEWEEPIWESSCFYNCMNELEKKFHQYYTKEKILEILNNSE